MQLIEDVQFYKKGDFIQNINKLVIDSATDSAAASTVQPLLYEPHRYGWSATLYSKGVVTQNGACTLDLKSFKL